jgi:16S rRNA (guanine(966)-N(2))-methyltransferase RsmD
MRIIAGRYKSRRLASPRWAGLRPTSDKLRETLFDILAPRIEGARVLDGFAGTGALGIEALSRGAAHVTFVDRDRRAMRLVAENLGRCGIADGYVMMPGDIVAFAQGPRTRQFDVILLDPPYDEPDLGATIETVGQVLAGRGVLVLEHARRRPAPASAGDLVRTREVVSGDSALAFYARGDSAGARAEPLRA